MKREIYIVLVFGVLVLMSSYLVSAGIGDWWAGITGRATSGVSNATVTLTGSNNVSVRTFNESLSVSHTENSYTAVDVTIEVTDADGIADINDSSVDINVSRGSEAVKYNSSCVANGETTASSKNYSCIFDMWYFEEAGSWLISAVANDYGTQNYVNNLTYFTFPSASTIVLSPASLTWPGISPGQTNQTSDNDPMVVNNTGNYNIDNLTITGRDLGGVTTPGSWLNVGNFTVDNSTGGGACSGADCVECGVGSVTGGVTMGNGTQLEIYGAILNRGNHSANDGITGQEQLYFCIPSVPTGLISQSYSTSVSGSDEWSVTLVE